MKDLYRQVIMDHYKYPRHKGLLADKDTLLIHMNNPSCGDEITVQLKCYGDHIVNVQHEGTGCSICCASASVMSQAIIEHNVSEALAIIHTFYELVKGMPYNQDILYNEAQAFSGVADFPARIKCATLAWKAAEKGLNKLKEDK